MGDGTCSSYEPSHSSARAVFLHALQAELEIKLALPTLSDESRELRIVDEIDTRTEIGTTNVPARSKTAA